MTQILDKEEQIVIGVPRDAGVGINNSQTIIYDITIPEGEIFDRYQLTNDGTDINVWRGVSISSGPYPGQTGQAQIIVCIVYYSDACIFRWRIQAFSKTVSDVILGDDAIVSITGDKLRVYPPIEGTGLQMSASGGDDNSSYLCTLNMTGGGVKAAAATSYEQGHDEASSSESAIELTPDKLHVHAINRGWHGKDSKTSSIDLSSNIEVRTQNGSVSLDQDGTFAVESRNTFLGHQESGTLKYGLWAGAAGVALETSSSSVRVDQIGTISLSGPRIIGEASDVVLGTSEAGTFKRGLCVRGGRAFLMAGGSTVQVGQDDGVVLIGQQISGNAPDVILGHSEAGSLKYGLCAGKAGVQLQTDSGTVRVNPDGAIGLNGREVNLVGQGIFGEAPLVSLGHSEAGSLKYGIIAGAAGVQLQTDRGTVRVNQNGAIGLVGPQIDLTGQEINGEAPIVFLGHHEAGSLKYGLCAGVNGASLETTGGHVRLDPNGAIDLRGQKVFGEASEVFLGHHEAGTLKYGLCAGANGASLETSGGHVRLDPNGAIDIKGAKVIYMAAPSVMVGPGTSPIDLLATIRDLQKRVAILEKKLSSIPYRNVG